MKINESHFMSIKIPLIIAQTYHRRGLNAKHSARESACVKVNPFPFMVAITFSLFSCTSSLGSVWKKRYGIVQFLVSFNIMRQNPLSRTDSRVIKTREQTDFRRKGKLTSLLNVTKCVKFFNYLRKGGNFLRREYILRS